MDRTKRKPSGEKLSPKLFKTPPKPTNILCKEGAKKFRQLARLYVSEGILTKFDVDKLTAMCLEWGRYERCIKVLQKDGEFWKSKKSGYTQVRPEGTQANKSLAAFTKLLSEFGGDPASRGKLKVVTEVKDGHNEFGDI